MKKVVIMSDNHGQHNMMDRIRNKEKDADVYVHCGDSEAEESALHGWIAVKGNNDWISMLENEEIFEVDGIRFFVCHGHRLPFFDRNVFIMELLEKNHCQVLLYGHTHVPEHTRLETYHIINPGSTTLPRRNSDKSYCVILIEDGEMKVEFKKIT